ncbi:MULTISPECIES: hypothetical protein [Phyllobacteriaceae]|jgi:hypothetical protein|uniref:Uncharacterized protein n=1 Tax=Mesorhizobium hungaricum TaxID=1566387 RepID=A0A1C2DEL2_9HYPH|nr:MULTISPECIES: hypothetical protein [Mesorhizobium]MBN9232745.1 hypothetical protein [Mesorhizobium sp.]MDQ0330344.1 hypothetical protein [Mesorhizobium sp. YL-MeA3-2017]OCX13157.1 hypothetical protein QV13_26885 [Mesorhizobium hungaricum]
MTLWHENLHRIIARIDALMPKTGGLRMEYEELRAYYVDVLKLVEQLVAEEGGRFSWDGDTSRLRLAGIEATYTQEPQGLLRNWQAAARRRLAASDDPINLQGSGPAPVVAREV